MHNIPQVSLLLYLGSVAFAFAADPSFIFDLKTKTTAPDVLTRVYGRGLDDDGAKGVPIVMAMGLSEAVSIRLFFKAEFYGLPGPKIMKLPVMKFGWVM
jgi:hypothetical protein